MTVKPRIVVGWNEYVDLPDWEIRGLRAKIDTGARNSALHVEDVVEIPGDRVRFDVVLHREKRDRRVAVTARIVRRGRVRSSTGHYEMRYFVRTTLRLGGVERDIELSLVDREKMMFRMLLGRTALSSHYLIDAGHRDLTAARPRRKKKVRKKAKKKGRTKARDRKPRRSRDD